MKIPFIIIISLIVISCSRHADKKFLRLVSDTSITHERYSDLEYINRKNQLLNLRSISNGVDSFEMRIWYWGFVGGYKLINMRYTESNWVCNETQYFYSQNLLDSSVTHSINVPIAVKDIVSYFSSDSILRLPTQRAIPNFRDDIGDGQGCHIEISTKFFYKLLYYHCPEHFSDEYNKRFLKALLYLDTFFRFYFPWCKPVPN